MTEILKDRVGRKIGEIETIGGKKIIKDRSGRKLGEFDGKVTKDSSGRIVGSGNLLVALLPKYN